VRSNLGQVEEPVDLAQQMIVRDMPLKAEAVEQRLLHHPPLAHHRPNLLRPGEEKSAPGARIKQSFSTQSVDPSRPECAKSGHFAPTWRIGQIRP
jgi:hypothetical protein